MSKRNIVYNAAEEWRRHAKVRLFWPRPLSSAPYTVGKLLTPRLPYIFSNLKDLQMGLPLFCYCPQHPTQWENHWPLVCLTYFQPWKTSKRFSPFLLTQLSCDIENILQWSEKTRLKSLSALTRSLKYQQEFLLYVCHSPLLVTCED